MSILMEPRYSLTVNGTDLATFGVYTSGEKTFDSFEKELEFISIPGRSGDLIRPNKRRINSTITYSSFIAENLNANVIALRNFLASLPEEYVRIEDNRHNDEYLMGIHTGIINFEVLGVSDDGIYAGATFDLQFNVKPFRFLTNGDNTIHISSGGSNVQNPTLFNSYPLLKVIGNGVSTIQVRNQNGNTYRVSIDGNTSNGVYLDCETQNAYTMTGSGSATNIVYKNSSVHIDDHRYPVFGPGQNTISGSFSSVEVTPRWYRL